MTILNFISQGDLDLLDEDPRVAFMQMVNLAQRRFSDRSAQLEGEEHWNELEELRHSFMNVIVAAAKRFEIEPFATMDIPKLDAFSQSDHRQFKADLDHYITQLMIDNSIRAKQDSVEMSQNSKERIRTYLRALRESIEKADLTETKREALLKKLDAFELELEKRRLNILAVTRTVFELLALPGGVWSSMDVTHRLLTNVMHVVAAARAVEQENRQIPATVVPKALSAPRKPVIEPDDQIPF